MKYRKKPIVIEASQWFKNGDHPQDYSKAHDGFENGIMRKFGPDERKANNWEGDVVRYYRSPAIDGQTKCKHCSDIMHNHGWIDTLEGGHIVCPGDWIITGVQNEHYPCKPYIFEATYEKVEDECAACKEGYDHVCKNKQDQAQAEMGWKEIAIAREKEINKLKADLTGIFDELHRLIG